MEEMVVLVNTLDESLGISPKMYAHRKGLLHRAFSVFIFNRKGEMLLQKRAKHKYHTPNLWTNTCCSHQRPLETTIQAGKRRLKEEMGIMSEIESLTTFIYKSDLENGLIEHEFDHILVGIDDSKPIVNRDEVDSWKWDTLDNIIKEIEQMPKTFTPWFKIIMKHQYATLTNYIKNKRC